MISKCLPNRFFALGLLLSLLAGTFVWTPRAEARHYSYYGRDYGYHDYGYHRGYSRRCHRGYRGYGGYDRDYRTGRILQGGLVGAGVGAGTGLLTGRPVGRTALIGAGIGAGVQAARYSHTLRRHPILRTAAYGALAGTGVAAVTGDGRQLGQGALWGGGIGAGLGALSRY